MSEEGPEVPHGSTEPLVIIESPYFHSLSEMRTRYHAYLKACVLDSISRCEAPFASHAFYTQFLSDLIPSHRALGLRLARRFYYVAAYIAVYQDFGVSPGMREGIKRAESYGLPIYYRKIGWNDDQRETLSLPRQSRKR